MPKTAIHRVRQQLQVVLSTVEMELHDRPVARDKIKKACKAIDRLLSHIEELTDTGPTNEKSE